MKKLFIGLLTLIMSLSVMGCNKENTSESDKVQVYTSFYAMYDFAKMIGGDMADIYMLCPPGQEPHEFEPTARDIANLTDSDIFIYNGMGMEHWADTVVEALKSSDVICINTAYNAPFITDSNDPHVWLNPKNAYSQMNEICSAFVLADPKNAEYYKSNLDLCRGKIDTLINDYESAVDDFKSKDIIVSHDAYSNLCHAFGLNQIPLNGIDNHNDPSPARLAEVEAYIKDNGITHIFKEPLGTGTIVETIANDTATEILVLDPFEGNIEGKDYFTVMYENLNALITALS